MAGFVAIPLKTIFDNTGLKHAEKAFGKLGGTLKGILGAAGVSLGLSAMVSGFKDVTKAAIEDNKSQAQLNRQLKATVGANSDVQAAVEKSIQAMSLQAAVADDNIRPAFAQLIRSTGSVGQATKLTQLALDVSAGSGKDLTAVSIALGKAYNGNTGALSKLGIKIKDTKHPFEELQKAFKDAAKTAADNDPYARMNVALDNLKETTGRLLLPILNDLSAWFIKAEPGIEAFLTKAWNSDGVVAVRDALVDIWKNVLKPFIDWVMSTDVQTQLSNVFKSVGNLSSSLSDLAQSDAGQALSKLASDSILRALEILASLINGVADAIDRLNGKKILPISPGLGETLNGGLSNMYLSRPGATSKQLLDLTSSGMSSVGASIPKSFKGSGYNSNQVTNYNITVNGVIGDKALVGKAVNDALNANNRVGRPRL